MANTVDKKDVMHIATLARLSFTDEEAERFTGELNAILGYIEQLDAIDTAGVEPTSHALDLANVMREDEPKVLITHEQALENAPKSEYGHFEVPRVID